MMDPIDQACAREALDRDLAMQQRRPGGPARREDGLCANDCGDAAMQVSAFCCAECRDDWQGRQRAIARGRL